MPRRGNIEGMSEDTHDTELDSATHRRIKQIETSMLAAQSKISGEAEDRLQVIVQAELSRFHIEEKTRFIQALFEHHNVHRACVTVGISRMAALKAQRKDPVFAAAWAEALNSHLDCIEDHVLEMAKHSKTPLWAIFALKSHRPDIYGDQVTVNTREEHSLHIHLHGVDGDEIKPRGEVVDAETVSSEDVDIGETDAIGAVQLAANNPAGCGMDESGESKGLTPVGVDESESLPGNEAEHLPAVGGAGLQPPRGSDKKDPASTGLDSTVVESEIGGIE